MSRASEILTRAAFKPALGNLKPANGGGRRGKGKSVAAQSAVSYMSEGQPLNIDMNAEQLAREGYLGTIYVMRCVRLIAETVASLPWVAGPDPLQPATFDPTAPLVNLLGPSTPQSPAGPNADTSSRVFWIWTMVQYLLSGRFGWEAQLDRLPTRVKGKRGAQKQIVGLWPLVSALLSPKPSFDGTRWFNGYEYVTATGGPTQMKDEQVIYAWRPSVMDPRLPENVLESAQVSVYIARSVDKYIANLLKNDLVATTMVTTPPFAKATDRRAFQEQFHAQFSGINQAGKEIFVEIDPDEDDPPGFKPLQVERLAQTVVESGIIQSGETAKNEVCLAFGVPRSLIGDASQRTYANAASEYKNFWTITLLDFIAEMQDHVNFRLGPRVGNDMGWFDLSKVTALQPPSVFMPPAITDVITTGVANAAQIANVLGIPPASATSDSDTWTVDIGEESSTPSPSGRSKLDDLELRVDPDAYDMAKREALIRSERDLYRAYTHPELMRWLDEAGRRKKAPQSVQSFRNGGQDWEPMERETIVVARNLITRGEGIDQAKDLEQMVADVRALQTASRMADKVHAKLSKTYPQSTLGWVKDADWSGPTDTSLDDIEMDRRPGGRDQAKVAGIASAIAAGDAPAGEPIILVKTPDTEKLKVADGYHRTLARKRLDRKTVPAYIGHVSDSTGPWDKEMHDKKLNRSVEVFETRGFDEWADEFEGELEAAVDGA